MLKELKEEIKFMIEHPIITIFGLGTISGILPTLLCALLYKIFGI
jgi:hypothetical protein